MADLRDILERLLQRRDLGEAEAGELLVALTDPGVAPAMSGALLAALRSKGVTADEVRGFAGAMRSLARHPVLPPGPPAIDIVGTGGDASGSFNLSTGAALLVAAMGVRHKELMVDGVQFHPESILTPDGPTLMGNFLASRGARRAG